MPAITLHSPTDWDGFRRAARGLLQAGTPPEAVQWHDQPRVGPADLWAAAEAAADGPPDAPAGAPGNTAAPGTPPGSATAQASPPEATAPPQPHAVPHTSPHTAVTAAPTLRLPAALLGQLQSAALHRDPQRWTLLYRWLWRCQQQPALRHDALDVDWQRLQRMAQAVRRDMHKMRAFVRFRPTTEADGQTLHIAWFEPAHHITEANAPFFVRRFTQMRWALLTPDASLRWDGHRLDVGPGAQRSDAPAPDAGEALWLTYYRSTFNPARLKLDMMRREMPRRYWHNLPEAALIGELAQGAAEHSGRMLAAEPTTPQRRLPKG